MRTRVSKELSPANGTKDRRHPREPKSGGWYSEWKTGSVYCLRGGKTRRATEEFQYKSENHHRNDGTSLDFRSFSFMLYEMKRQSSGRAASTLRSLKKESDPKLN